MKEYNRASLPDSITYNGRVYKPDVDKTHLIKVFGLGHSIDERGCILVNVLPGILKGRTDLHGREYTPKHWIYSTELLYKVVKVMRVSGRRQVLEKELTKEEAKRVVARYKDSTRSMVVFQSY